MILRKEITTKALEWSVPPETIDKDWVLGHFLSSFCALEENKNALVFKGGTALRKCYFPNYRFSEDLDFTSLKPDYELTKGKLGKAIRKTEGQSGILFHIQEISELIFKNKLVGYQAKIKYWGANHSKNQEPPTPARWMTNLKVEITLFEKLVFKPKLKTIYHPYSDSALLKGKEINCYDLREVFVEKLRALIQRSYVAPRDYYDIYNLSKHFNEQDWRIIKPAFLEKMKFKGLEFEGTEQLVNQNSIKKIAKAWEQSLAHQIPQEHLPDVKIVVAELINILTKHFQ